MTLYAGGEWVSASELGKIVFMGYSGKTVLRWVNKKTLPQSWTDPKRPEKGPQTVWEHNGSSYRFNVNVCRRIQRHWTEQKEAQLRDKIA